MLLKKTSFSYLIATCILASTSGVSAQNVTPSTVNNLNTNVIQIGSQYNISGGTQAGANLFYSLQKLGLSSGEIANFLSNSSVQNILTRVTGGEASLINGLIQVTGGNSNLFILNPAGIVFGANASLNVPANFSASTASAMQVGNGWFGMNSSADQVRNLSGNVTGYAFNSTLPNLGSTTGTSASGVILNQGNLSVSTGKSVTLVGGMVVNTGTIATPEGKITIAATPDNKFITITNEGSVLSFDLPIADQQAIGNAPVLRGVDLPTLLTGKTAGTVIASGTLDVSGNQGGKVQVLGKDVNLASANINASGVNGGGTVLIGGDYQGAGTTPKSQSTTVDSGSTINANALTAGNGGTVVVWSDGITRFDGKIAVKAGSQSGNGGLIEISGKANLAVGNNAQVNASAPNGVRGTWLLDPTTLTVATTGGDITPATIVTNLDGANFDLQASSSITVSDAIDSGNNTSGGNLSLSTVTVNLNAPITLFSGSVLSGTATTTNVGANGTIQNGVDVSALGGTVNLAPTTYTLSDEVYINKNLTLNGNATTVDGNSNTRLFYIDSGNTVNINDLTLVNGSAEDGGAIYNNNSTVNIGNTTFSNNEASSGGAIYSEGSSASLTITNSTFTSNRAGSDGGAIYNYDGVDTITDSTFTSNSAGEDGGAIYNYNGTDTIANSTFDSNTAVGNGGALNNYLAMSITNSTFYGNTAEGNGGAVYNQYTSPPYDATVIANSTFYGNSATDGGAIYVFDEDNDGYDVAISNSIIVGNNATGAGNEIYNGSADSNLNFIGANIVGTFGNNGIEGSDGSSNETYNDSVDSNLNFISANIVGTFSAGSSYVGVAPLVPTGAANTVIETTLANNGGSTQTLKLAPNSIAIDASGENASESDQRGNNAVGIRDIGSFECVADECPPFPPVVIPEPIPTITPTPVPINPNQITIDQNVEQPPEILPSTPVTFASVGSINIQAFDNALTKVVDLMNQNGGTFTLNADEFVSGLDASTPANQLVIKAAIADSISKSIGEEFVGLVDIKFQTKDGKTTAQVTVSKSTTAAKLKK